MDQFHTMYEHGVMVAAETVIAFFAAVSIVGLPFMRPVCVHAMVGLRSDQPRSDRPPMDLSSVMMPLGLMSSTDSFIMMGDTGSLTPSQQPLPDMVGVTHNQFDSSEVLDIDVSTQRLGREL